MVGTGPVTATEPVPRSRDPFAGYEEIVWDGRVHSYRPAVDWRDRIWPGLKLHSQRTADLDAVTFEVLRNRLWTINVAHGETLTRISGSPVFQSLDFGMTILTEDGELVMNAPFVQYHSAGSPLVTRYVLEHYSEAPGIEEGDIFLASDPWVGVPHQMDVTILQPVFVEGSLFAWVANAAHQYDLGGVVPGGWPQSAVDVYSDPVMFKPFKLVERGVIRPDLEEMVRRQSRMPDLVALDLRAQLAGCRFAAQSLQSACDEFGAATVKAAMHEILDRAQRALAAKLDRIPDGRWSEVRYFDEKLPGDRHTHRIQVNVEKRGDRLIVDNLGTDAQTEGPIGFPYIDFAGAFMGILSVMMLYEHTFSIGGGERQVDFRPLPGLITCVDYPAAVAGSVVNICTYMHAVMNVLSRMLTCDPELRADVIAGGGEIALVVVAGTNDRGEAFGTGIVESGAGAGTGARSQRDGVATTGFAFVPQMRIPDVEATELFYPFLMLYRRELEDSASAGHWRGGVGLEFAFTPYRAGTIEAITNCGGMGISTSCGASLFGAYPVPAARYEVVQGSDVLERFAQGEVPRTGAELVASDRLRLRAKSNGTPLAAGDVMVTSVQGGGGYGDPLERDPEHVARDVGLGCVSARAASDVYGVVVRPNGSVDADTTAQRREATRAERGAWQRARQLIATPAHDEVVTAATGAPARHVHPAVLSRDEGDRRVLACARCNCVLSDYRSDYRLGLLADASPVTVIPNASDPSYFLDDEVLFWRFCCPGCHVLMSTQIARAGDEFVTEMQLA